MRKNVFPVWIRLFEHDVTAHLLRIDKGRLHDAGLHVALTDAPAAARLSEVWNEAKSGRLPPDFLRLFKQESGLTYHDCVNECHHKKVAALLHENKTKSGISDTPGFSHPSAFLRWMKRKG